MLSNKLVYCCYCSYCICLLQVKSTGTLDKIDEQERKIQEVSGSFHQSTGMCSFRNIIV